MNWEVITANVNTGRVRRRQFGDRAAALEWVERVERVARKWPDGLRAVVIELRLAASTVAAAA
jgi:hypothetical protein